MKLTVPNSRVVILGPLILFAAVAASAAEPLGVEFPGKPCWAISPDGRYAVVNIDSEMDSQLPYLGDNHALYLLDLKVPGVKRIHSYGRSASVIWSPRGSAFLINDRTGSDSSNVILFLVARGTKIDVSRELRRGVRDKSIIANHHVYIEGSEWLAENTLKIKVHGYGDLDPNGFEHWYEYVVGASFKRLN